MAFTVTAEHDRQLKVWKALRRSPYRQAYEIRRMPTEGAVRATDRRVQFIRLEAYRPRKLSIQFRSTAAKQAASGLSFRSFKLESPYN